MIMMIDGSKVDVTGLTLTEIHEICIEFQSKWCAEKYGGPATDLSSLRADPCSRPTLIKSDSKCAPYHSVHRRSGDGAQGERWRMLPVFNLLLTCKSRCDSSIYVLTCFSNKSLLADKQVTKYFVKLKNELSTSNVRCSRDDLCNINDITRNPRFWSAITGTKKNWNENMFSEIFERISWVWRFSGTVSFAYLDHMLLHGLWTFN